MPDAQASDDGFGECQRAEVLQCVSATMPITALRAMSSTPRRIRNSFTTVSNQL